ncbi:MAG: hypothetical protein KY466_06015 [Gemmatimonadetes bacterium]|nr:hypothetical protein [Gemmatimonadota bacterium]
MTRRSSAAVPCLLVLGLWGCAGAGAPPAPEVGAGAVIRVVPEAGATAVGVALAVPGSGWEDAGTSGLSMLAAHGVLEEVGGELRSLGARAEVACGRWAFVFRLVAPAETWRRAAAVLAQGLRRPGPSAAAVERARASLAAALSLDRGSPAWQSRLAVGRALYAPEGGESAWSRPGCGVTEALPLFDVAAVGEAAARLGRVGSVAAVGAVEGGDSVLLAELFGGRAPGVASFPLPLPPTPGRVYVERNTVTAWVAVAWPFGPGADPDAMRLLGVVLEDAFGPAVSRPDVLHTRSDVELHGGGGALVVTVVAVPDAAARVVSTLESAVSSMAAGKVTRSVVERVARRHRGERLRALVSPADRAARIALEGARGGAGAAGWVEPASFTVGAVRHAAGALGAPARAVVGPRASRGAVLP